MQSLRTILLIMLALLSASCHFLNETVVPVNTTEASFSNKTDTLLILIPGIADDEQTFKQAGFFTSLEKYNTNVDVITAHVHLGYLINKTYIERIDKDVIQSARKRGYKKIWIVGVSLGAYIALNYVQQRPDVITGLVLLGPYLGEDKDLKVIRQAGGIGMWQPNNIEHESRTLRLWYWHQQRMKKQGLNNYYLGYGNKDHLGRGIRDFIQLLPQANVKTVSGGHDWSSWLNLWEQFLEDDIFSR